MSIVRLNPIATWVDFDNGTRSAVTMSNQSYSQVERSTSIRRRKPKDLKSFSSNTAGWTQVDTCIDGSCERRSGLPPNGNVTHSTVLTMGGFVGQRPGDPEYVTQINNRLLSEARGMNVNLGNALAEYRETAATFERAAIVFASMLKTFASRDYRWFVHALANGAVSTSNMGKRTSGAVLEFQYGVKPLVQNVMDSVSAFKNRAASRPIYQTVQARQNWVADGSNTSGSAKSDWSWKASVHARAQVVFQNSVLNASLGQFGLTNPFSVLWEITPWSHVVDWWFNVGEVLASLDNCLYIQSITAYRTYRRTYTESMTRYNGEARLVHTYSARSGPYSPGLTAGFRYKPSISKQHILNGMAHIGQILTTGEIGRMFRGSGKYRHYTE